MERGQQNADAKDVVNTHTLSVVLICYNNANTIERAIRSIARQDIKGIKAECIIADDCSTDNSREVCAQLIPTLKAAGYDVTFIRRPQNGGVGPARRTGIDAARGEFFTCLDGDDEFLGCDTFKHLLGFAREHDTDCVVFGGQYDRYNEGQADGFEYEPLAANVIEIEPRAAAVASFTYRIIPNVWGKLWRRTLHTQYPHSTARWVEDWSTTPVWMFLARSVYILPLCGIRYHVNPESVTHKERIRTWYDQAMLDLCRFFEGRDKEVFQCFETFVRARYGLKKHMTHGTETKA